MTQVKMKEVMNHIDKWARIVERDKERKNKNGRI